MLIAIIGLTVIIIKGSLECKCEIAFSLPYNNKWSELREAQNNAKLLYSLYDANGEEWVINNIIKNGVQFFTGFGEKDLIVIKGSNDRYNYNTYTTLIKGIKRGFDLLSERNDTLHAYYPIFFNADALNSEESDISDILCELYSINDKKFKENLWNIGIRFSSLENDSSKVCVVTPPFFRIFKFNSEIIRRKYNIACDSLKAKKINPLKEITDATYNDYKLYLHYLFEANRIILQEDDEARHYILPITYDGTKSIYEAEDVIYSFDNKKNYNEDSKYKNLNSNPLAIVTIVILCAIVSIVFKLKHK